MSKTKIEWCDYTINPVKGKCPMGCPYCYARRLYDRFKWNPEIRLDEETFIGAFGYFTHLPPEAKVFIGSTMELFGDWIKVSWLRKIFDAVHLMPDRTFIFLTKQPQNLIKWSPFPENCWVGVTATNQKAFLDAIYALVHIKATVRYISFEPLLAEIPMTPEQLKASCNWLIIGACTGTWSEMDRLERKVAPLFPYTLMQWGTKWTLQPKIEWIREIVEAADKAGVKVFLKDNLIPLLSQSSDESKAIWAYSVMGLRQEMPIEQ